MLDSFIRGAAVLLEIIKEIAQFDLFVDFEPIGHCIDCPLGKVFALGVAQNRSSKQVRDVGKRVSRGRERAGLGIVFYQFADDLHFHN